MPIDLVELTEHNHRAVRALGLYLSMGFEIQGTEDGEIALYRRPLSR